MNEIIKTPVAELGYHFIHPRWIPAGEDEYYLRREQNPDAGEFRSLTPDEIVTLTRNGNESDDWSRVVVKDPFHVNLIHQCKFHGWIRLGRLEPFYLQFHDLRLPVGLYNSTIISCDLGDHVVVNNINYLSHMIVGNDVMLVNVNEIGVTDRAKFGNGIIKEGEKEQVRIWMELCNENAGRKVLLFDGMQTGDAWLWTRFRDDEKLMQRLQEFTENKFDRRRGYYGKIGDRTVIKNTRIVKDCIIGTDAYIKGANKLKNLTIHSSAEAPTQIGEGCELVNGIIGYGCKAFYGVKAVRFILASHSQLKYGARLINSFLGDNSTISCCEVLNSLIFPAHEQHHNNSFLCASLLGGQSNMAAGATIGSNHNSRGADGELIAGRGFWPGLCVSLKHNSKFASYTLIAKGDFPAELDISLPFSLVSNDVSRDRLLIMPGYWFHYNMYALARNVSKYASRDKRSFKNQYIEYDYLAPDSVNELFQGLEVLAKAVAESIGKAGVRKKSADQLIREGKKLLENPARLARKEIFALGIENSKRKVQILKAGESYQLFKELIQYYGVLQMMEFFKLEKNYSLKNLTESFDKAKRESFVNLGGQLMPYSSLEKMISHIKNGAISSWDEIHATYHQYSADYPRQKMQHAFASLLEILDINPRQLTVARFKTLIKDALKTRKWMVEGIRESRAKDYENPFRQMVYESRAEMEKVIGKLTDNSFIKEQELELKQFEKELESLRGKIKA